MAFFVRDCVRCGVKLVQHTIVGFAAIDATGRYFEIAGSCHACSLLSIYQWRSPGNGTKPNSYDKEIDTAQERLSKDAIRIATVAVELSEYIPERVRSLFREANECRQMTWYEAAGAMYRKTLDVATKYIYAHDARLAGKNPAQALRVRIQGMGALKIIDEDIVELADIAALDGNDAVHDADPYTKDEAEALEELTLDLLDRMFVRPAKIAAVKAKQIAAGVRKA
ncbi:hypothetical protein B5K08_16060 [Rhizobium leguminosarum bv. trifolii]|uniref:DUF4145 domain-containing protein n=1 Tax=Rhizobium leguminosarum bv. trifolii TaxID=386 RepID=A0A3E1BGV2_RHILT|nr:DUF4145 domain-containing protein [Rhizobium leguminosarum]RFB91806.1 hypothetical protein B5K08_16060 [Rhizobium leguminosarum bv. trifolii]RFB92323.1 hypothetical protein B5K10_16055 [Rhizobium leguminosarum bv. trifolii]